MAIFGAVVAVILMLVGSSFWSCCDGHFCASSGAVMTYDGDFRRRLELAY